MRITNQRVVPDKKFPRYDMAVGGLLTQQKDTTNKLCRPNGSTQVGWFMTIPNWYPLPESNASFDMTKKSFYCHL
jgi:hypothetical protein